MEIEHTVVYSEVKAAAWNTKSVIYRVLKQNPLHVQGIPSVEDFRFKSSTSFCETIIKNWNNNQELTLSLQQKWNQLHF